MTGTSEGAGDGRPDGIPAAAGPHGVPEGEVLEPMQVPTQQIIAIGMLLWLVALAVTLLVPALHEGDRAWWPWTCVTGLVLGVLGLLHVRRGRGSAHDAT